MKRSNSRQVKKQVITAVAKYAAAGAPWKRICEGVLQVNGIDQLEIQKYIEYAEKPRSTDAFQLIQ